jgi:hypothetical protein
VENIEQIFRASIVQVTDPAEPGLKPVEPNLPLHVVLGIIVGLVGGVGFAFFVEYLDTSFKAIDVVEQTLGASVIGIIPQNVGYLKDDPTAAYAEAYRVLRTNILFGRKNETMNTITVVSGGAAEGKSTSIMNWRRYSRRMTTACCCRLRLAPAELARILAYPMQGV